MSSVNSYRCPFHLLEITLISAQELASVSKNMHTYAVTWIDPSRRLTTRVDRNGLGNPSWNDKFIFRVDDAFLATPTSAVMVDIYAVSWLRDIPLGSVRLLLSNLLPPPPPPPNTSAAIGRRMRFAALQVRRPSGRPQGILNIGFTVLERTMRSMPLYTELCLSPAATDQGSTLHTTTDAKLKQDKNKGNRDQTPDQRVRTLRRTKSDRPDKYQQPPGSVYEGSEYGGSTQVGSEIGAPAWNGSICSDVGPSPSVVAAAVARGLYKPPGAAADDDDGAGSMVLDEWTEESSVEGLRSKLERWRLEMPPIYDRSGPSEDGNAKVQQEQQQQRRQRKHNRRNTEGGGGRLFSCFANAYGCEFSVKCGSKTKKKNKQVLIGNGPNGGGGRSKVLLSPSEVDSSYLSQSYV